MINLYCIRPKGFNIGNDVIYLGLNHFVRSAFKENLNIISLPATSKYESQKKAGINAQTVYEINQFGHGLIVGGGNLYENGELEINANAIKALEVPLMPFSIARGKIYNKELKLVDRTDVMTDSNIKLLNEYALISLSRDNATKEYLDSIGAKNILGGCPTLFINEIPQHLVPISEADRTDALISVRTPTLMSVPISFQYQVREHIWEMIEILKKNGYQRIKILCHDHRDIPFAATFEGVEYLYTEDVYTYLTFLKNTRLNVTYRLHSALPCLAFDIPVIKISYDQRATSLLDTIGMSDWNINMLKMGVIKEFTNRLNNLSDLDSMKSKLRKSKWPELRDILVSSCNTFCNAVYQQTKS